MVDHLCPEERSRLMRSVRRKDTAPEIVVRKCAHALGYRFRLHRKDLPGKPDLVFPGRRKAVFVHGCFWHRHSCKRGTIPGSNRGFWEEKLNRNAERDAAALSALERQGWSALVIWECEVKKPDLAERLASFIST